MHTRISGAIPCAVIAVVSSLWVNAVYADIDNFARRIGEATLNRLRTGSEDPAAAEKTQVWTNLSYRNEQFSSPFPLRYSLSTHSDIGQFTLGADRFWSKWSAGVAVAYAQAATASESGESFFLTSGWTETSEPGIAGYLGYKLSDHWLIQGIAGYSHPDFSSAVHSVFGGREINISGSSDDNAAFSDLSVNYAQYFSNWFVQGRIGHRFIHAERFPDDYANIIYGLGEVGFKWDRWQPFFRARIEEYIYADDVDDQLAHVGIGVNYRLAESVNLGLVYERELKQEYVETNQAILTASFRF